MTSIFSETMIGLLEATWKLGINDPTLMAWIIVCFYLFAMWFCWHAGRHKPVVTSSTAGSNVGADANSSASNNRSSTSILWLTLAVIMLLMGLNKQLDLHVPIFSIVQKVLHSNEVWTGNSTILVTGAVGLGLALLALGIKLLLRQAFRLQLAYLALASLLALQAVRFSPSKFSKILVYHLLNEDENWLHMHTIEIVELLVLIIICWLARKKTQAIPSP